MWACWHNCMLAMDKSMFRDKYPDVYPYISSMSTKRRNLFEYVETMFNYGTNVYFFTLTFNNDKDTLNEKTKRKEAWRLFEEFAQLVVMVEEYGETNERYHLHGFMTFKRNKTIQEFYEEWHSIAKIMPIYEFNYKKRIKYLTKYSVKNAPRLRRNKALIELCKKSRWAKHLKNDGFECLIPRTETQARLIADSLPF